MDKEIIHNMLSSREILYQCIYIPLAIFLYLLIILWYHWNHVTYIPFHNLHFHVSIYFHDLIFLTIFDNIILSIS